MKLNERKRGLNKRLKFIQDKSYLNSNNLRLDKLNSIEIFFAEQDDPILMKTESEYELHSKIRCFRKLEDIF